MEPFVLAEPPWRRGSGLSRLEGYANRLPRGRFDADGHLGVGLGAAVGDHGGGLLGATFGDGELRGACDHGLDLDVTRTLFLWGRRGILSIWLLKIAR